MISIKITNIEAVVETKALLESVIVNSIEDLDSELYNLSPVDTGLFRNSWTVGGQIEATKVGEITSRNAKGQFAAGGRRGIYSALGTVIRLANNLPYANALREGWSKQAPRGWVEACVSRMQDHINSHILRSGRKDGN